MNYIYHVGIVPADQWRAQHEKRIDTTEPPYTVAANYLGELIDTLGPKLLPSDDAVVVIYRERDGAIFRYPVQSVEVMQPVRTLQLKARL